MMLHAYMDRGHVEQVDKICLAVAGPVESDLIDLPNSHWSFSRAELQTALGVSVTIINDFSAQVLCIDALSDSEALWIGAVRPEGGQVKAIVGPGTGLGVSAMLPGGGILPSEGGHVAFAPLNDHEANLQKELRQRYERVSVERVLSGMGLANLYWANGRLDGYDRELPAPEVTAGALDEHPGLRGCVEALRKGL